MRYRSLLLSMLCIAAVTDEVKAFEFSPFRVKFDPSGSGASQLFTVDNNTDQPAGVQISATTRDADENGVEKNTDAEKDFTIYPAQLVLKPHSQRSVRIQWLGDPNLKKEKAYRIIAEQLPVNLDKEKPKHSAVRFLVDYRAAAFVTPFGLAPDVVLESSRATTVGGKKMLEILFNNRGTQHALLRNLTLDIKDNKGNAVTLSGDNELMHVTGEGILAGHKRRFLLPWPKALSGTPGSIAFTFDKQAF